MNGYLQTQVLTSTVYFDKQLIYKKPASSPTRLEQIGVVNKIFRAFDDFTVSRGISNQVTRLRTYTGCACAGVNVSPFLIFASASFSTAPARGSRSGLQTARPLSSAG